MGNWGSTLLGIIVGGLLAGGAGLVLEAYRRDQDRKGIASVVLGTMRAVFRLAEMMRIPEALKAAQEAERRGAPVPPLPFWVRDEPKLFEILHGAIERIGILGGETPALIVELYGCLNSFVLSLQRRHAAETDAAQAEAAGGLRASVEWLCQCYNRADELRRELDPKLEEIATRPFFHLLR